MSKRVRTVELLIVLAVTIFATACPQRETISKINADPGRYKNKEVAVVGRVTDSYGLLNMGVYEIDDGTGRLMVVTRSGVPARGSKVGAKGRVYTAASFGGKNFGTVLEESERRAK